MQAREWLSEVFGLVVRVMLLGMVWASASLLAFAAESEPWMAWLGLLGVALGLLLLRKTDALVRFTYGRRADPAIRQP